MRTITFELDSKSIGRAVKQVEQYRKDLENACQELVARLTDAGEQIAKLQVISLGAFDTGELESSIIGYYSPSLRAGLVKAGAWHAVFVEYGTGVVGQSNQHPIPEGWSYDVSGHGDSGWVYKSDRDGNFHWTNGMPSRPFMYNTLRELEQKVGSVADEVFSRLL